MEYENELVILCNLYLQITKEKNKNRRIALINDYINLVSYLDELKIIKSQDYIDNNNLIYKPYIEELNKVKSNFIKDFNENFNYIKFLNNKLIDIYNNHSLQETELTSNNIIPLNQTIDILFDFFGNLGNDFYKVIEKIFDNNHISHISTIKFEGATYNIGNKYGQYIIIRKKEDEFDYNNASCLAHELGHCYELSLYNKNRISLPFNFLTEVCSIFIQKLFDLYNIENNIYQKEALNCQLEWYITLKEQALVNEYAINKHLNNENNKVDYNTLAFEFHNLSSDKLLEDTKKALKKYSPSIYNFLYVISDQVANYFISIYQENEKEGLKLLKRFLLTYRNKPLKQILYKYGMEFDKTENLINNIQKGRL